MFDNPTPTCKKTNERYIDSSCQGCGAFLICFTVLFILAILTIVIGIGVF